VSHDTERRNSLTVRNGTGDTACRLMTHPVVLAFVSVVAVSLVSLAGLLTLSMSETRVRRLAAFFVSFAVGALLGDTFIHLVPEIFDAPPLSLRASLLILGGILRGIRVLVIQTALISAGIAAMALLKFVE